MRRPIERASDLTDTLLHPPESADTVTGWEFAVKMLRVHDGITTDVMIPSRNRNICGGIREMTHRAGRTAASECGFDHLYHPAEDRGDVEAEGPGRPGADGILLQPPQRQSTQAPLLGRGHGLEG